MNIARKLCIAGLLAVFAAACAAQGTKTTIKKEAAPVTSAASGSEMYESYCASCHGKDATGNGPAAPALKSFPANLTTLAKRNGGKYPEARVTSILEGKEIIISHGSQDMPVWGPMFRTVSGRSESIVQMRVSNLNRYLESLQVK